MILDLQLGCSLCLSELLPSLQPSQTDISHIPPPVSQPQSQVEMPSRRPTTREPVVMSMCVFFPKEESQTGEAIQRAPSGQAKDVKWLTQHGLHQSPADTNRSSRVQGNVSVQGKCAAPCLSMVERTWRMSLSASWSLLNDYRKQQTDAYHLSTSRVDISSILMNT